MWDKMTSIALAFFINNGLWLMQRRNLVGVKESFTVYRMCSWEELGERGTVIL